jgi:hypothetical protein
VRVAVHGVQLGGIDWGKLAQSFAADGVTVETEQALANTLQTALQSKRTTVIGVRIDAPATSPSSMRCGSCDRDSARIALACSAQIGRFVGAGFKPALLRQTRSGMMLRRKVIGNGDASSPIVQKRLQQPASSP